MQVRFRPNVITNSFDHLADKMSLDFTETGFDELTNITSSFGNSDSISILRNRYPPDNAPTQNQFYCKQTLYDVSEAMENNVNKMCNLSVDTECHLKGSCQSVSFLKTTDHLPQQPLPSCGPVYSSKNCPSDAKSSSDQDPRELPTYSFTHSESLSLSSLTDLSCLDSNTTSFCNPGDATLNFSQPVFNTTKALEQEIKSLSRKVNNASKEHYTDEIRLEAERVVNEACNTLPAGDNSINPLILNPRITVNVPENVSTYENLIDLTVDESEIVRLERQRIAAQRKRLLEANRKQNIKVDEPEPDLLEFFDPNRHVYQSVNLQSKGIRSLLPTLHCASDDLVNVFQHKIACDYSFWLCDT
ncbi:unnamed protein product [Schistosoma rodhaini]|uniref:hypothetical protein n=1 Tax=Schistosoma mansoni TaxID=6183 RepID=UPI0001A63986|nr:hypothetical protein Smp_155630.1 [Schistosoma mansoni]CAH8528957.1 unnamed protein product [Schistosoma rodhaini]|eukprot:XP_018645344.1 hypothetical protein Smp_155630.1 [Schistosoma mansoni]